MIGNSSSIPPLEPQVALKIFLQQLEGIRTVVLELTEVRRQADELERQRAEQKAALAEERRKHETTLWADRQAIELEGKAIERLRQETVKLNEQAKADLIRVAAKESDADERLAKLQGILSSVTAG